MGSPAGSPETGSRQTGFVLLCSAAYGQFVAMGIFLSALPLYITRSLGGSRTAVGLAVGAFSLSAVLLRPLVGRGVDQRGRRPFLIGGPLLMALSSAGLFAARGVWMVAALRLVQGVAGACYYTAGATVATDMAPEGRRADYIARFSLFLYGGFATGPAVGEFLVSRWGFGAAWAFAGGAALTAAFVSSFVPETLAAVPAGSPPARRFRYFHPAAYGPGFVIMTAAVGYVAISIFSPLYARRIGMTSSGPLYAVFAVTVLCVRLFAGRLADRRGRVAVGLPALLTGAAGFVLLAFQPAPALAFVGVAAYAACFAALFPALMALTVDGVPDPERGAALGSYTAFFDIGASGGSYLLGAAGRRVGIRRGVLAARGAVRGGVLRPAADQGGGGGSGASSGNVTQNVVPSPGRLVRPTVPPSSSPSRRTIHSPRPVPGTPACVLWRVR